MASTNFEPEEPQPKDELPDYNAWDSAIVEAVQGLTVPKTRAQHFITEHPTVLSQFRGTLSSMLLAIPLASFQLHPTYLLRFLLAEWKDEELKEFRKDGAVIISKALERVRKTQQWRSGNDECWEKWGYKGMDDLYENYTSTKDQDAVLQKWYFQAFYGTDVDGRPIHYELLPNTYHENLMTTLIIRRLLNNEKTLRDRIPNLNPTIGKATPEQLADPIIGVTWVLDARNLSLFATSAMYKTMTGLMGYSSAITAAHYPEQGHRALIINLGSFLISLYTVAIKLMPAQTQRTTNCYAGRDVLDDIAGKDNVPLLFRKQNERSGITGFTSPEIQKQKEGGDLGHWLKE